MPIKRYNEYQKHAIVKSGIGSTPDDIDARYAKVAAFINEDKKQDALKEIENTRFALLSAINNVNYDSYCFACFVHSIDGVLYDDLSDDGLDFLLTKLAEAEITQLDIETAIEEVKKKVNNEIELLFPDLFNVADSLVYYGKIKMYLIEMGQELQNEEPNIDEIRKRLLWFQVYNKPMNFRSNDTDNVLIEIDRSFADMCSMMENNGSNNPHLYTCTQFYAKLNYLHKSTQPAAA